MPTRTGCFIPIRLDSERLPGKALKPAAGRPIVHHLLDRACAARLIREPADVVVCTTEEPGNASLVEAVESYGCSVFRGDRDDLIQRFKDAADAFGFDHILQIDGDDPLCDPAYMDLVLQALADDPALDAAVTTGLPFGMNVKAFTRAAVDKVHAGYKSYANDTGFALYFVKSELCRCRELPPLSDDHVIAEARLTLDYAEDLEVFRRILEALSRPGEVAGIGEIVGWLRAHPEVVAINANLQESYMERSRAKVDLSYTDADGNVRRIDY